MHLKSNFILLTIVCSLWTIGLNAQLKSFGSNTKQKPQPVYLFSVYGYYDIIRERGLGMQFHQSPKFNLDISVYRVDPDRSYKHKIRQWDYYDFTGYGFSLKPRFHLPFRNTWYLSPNISFEWLQHPRVWVEYMVAYHEIVNLSEDAKGQAYTIGFSLGKKICLNKFFLEPFLGIGITSFKGTKTTHEVDRPSLYTNLTFPSKENYRRDFFQMNIGIKMGYFWFKSKKHQAIDRKFDDVYIPRSDSLKVFFNSVTTEQLKQNKNLRLAQARYEGLNRNALVVYRNNYYNSDKLYRKIDKLFNRIDSLRFYGTMESR